MTNDGANLRCPLNITQILPSYGLRGKDLQEAMAYAESASALYQPSTDEVDASTNANALYIPPSFDTIDNRRKMSLNLGGGNCQWQPPTYEVPSEINFHKTIIAGYPSGDKRMIFTQMEALTGWPAKDEWDFEFLGMSNHPFIKANYPHHEGVWGWNDVADQVVMMVRNIRKSMIEYHDILYDLGVVYQFNIPDSHRNKVRYAAVCRCVYNISRLFNLPPCPY